MIQRFRKKDPQEIEVIKFFRENYEEVKEFTEGRAGKLHAPFKNATAYMTIRNGKNKLVAQEGMYIAKIRGEYFPFKADLFLKEYCEVELINLESL